MYCKSCDVIYINVRDVPWNYLSPVTQLELVSFTCAYFEEQTSYA